MHLMVEGPKNPTQSWGDSIYLHHLPLQHGASEIPLDKCKYCYKHKLQALFHLSSAPKYNFHFSL